MSGFGRHFGEEAVLVGSGGSGTIFLSGCNLACVFCQNSTISCDKEGAEVSEEELAEIMLELQQSGAENINWVTPTHVVPQLLEALLLAARNGLTLPIVYNCGGYEDAGVLDLLDGLINIYLPDAKFSSTEVAVRFASAPDYFPRACRAIRKMHTQVGCLRLDDRGVATDGVLVRHLVLPGDLAGSARWASALFRILGKDGAVNVMGQYRPEYKATAYSFLDRRVSGEEVAQAKEQFKAKRLKLVH